jgi:putative phosphoesterase
MRRSRALSSDPGAVASLFRVGLISDTHGLLRREACEALRGVRYILHAGDIGSPDVLDALARIAPVTAVRGNNDRAPWASALAECAHVTLAGVAIRIVHDLKQFTAGCDQPRVVVSGHSHRPLVQERAGVLFVNPGSAGPRRFNLPVSVAILDLADAQPAARIVALDRC